MFLLGAISNLMESEMAIEQATSLGCTAGAVSHLGFISLVSAFLYLIPKTNIFGAAALPAWLGGDVATHMIHQDPLVNTLTPVIFIVIVWAALWLRNENLRKLFPFN